MYRCVSVVEWREPAKDKRMERRGEGKKIEVFFFINKIQRFHLEIVGLEAIAGKNLIFLFLTSFFWTFLITISHMFRARQTKQNLHRKNVNTQARYLM